MAGKSRKPRTHRSGEGQFARGKNSQACPGWASGEWARTRTRPVPLANAARSCEPLGAIGATRRRPSRNSTLAVRKRSLPLAAGRGAVSSPARAPYQKPSCSPINRRSVGRTDRKKQGSAIEMQMSYGFRDEGNPEQSREKIGFPRERERTGIPEMHYSMR